MSSVIEQHYKENGDRLRIRDIPMNSAWITPVRGKLTKYAYGKLGNWEDAEEAVHDAYERAIRYHGSFKEGFDYEAWFFIILINVVNDVRAGRTNEPPSIEADDTIGAEEYLIPAETPEEAVSSLKWANVFNKLCLTLSRRDVSVLELYFLYGHKAVDVAELLNINIHTVKRILNENRKTVMGG